MTTTCDINVNIFDRWAEVYDTEPNPLLQLEDRTLPALLPALANADILDVGCGTGRWLQRLETHVPRSLAGSDPSAAMLERARAKVSATTALHQCSDLSGPDASLDFILASFVLSYIDDLDAFAAQCARMLRPNGHVLISDLHPTTVTDRNWIRNVKVDGERIPLPARNRPLSQIISIFNCHGLQLLVLEEPSIGEPEQPAFEQKSKLTNLQLTTLESSLSNLPEPQPQPHTAPDAPPTKTQSAYESLLNVPAIYLLKLQKREPTLLAAALTNTRWASSPSTWDTTPLSITNGSITRPALDLTGYVILPGLVNAHDHLEFALYPNLGRTALQPPYKNATEWAHEIHHAHADLIRQHQQVPLETRLWFGILRNLLCGVTTVCHHNPLHPELTNAELPIRIAANIDWAHSLAFTPDIAATNIADRPYILHAAEGVGSSARAELFELDRLEILTPRTVLVHGLALITRDINLLNDRGSALIFCPSSNQFLFGRTPPPHIINHVHRAALGSDSPLTAAGDLLDEIHILRQQGICPATLYNLVTTNPADLLQLTHGEGTLANRADLIAVRDTNQSPAATLAALTLNDIELVLVGGRVQLASQTLYQRLPASQTSGLHLLEIAGIERWVRAPLPSLFQSAEQVLGPGNLRLGNKEVRHLPTH